MLKRLLFDEDGQTTTEYILILFLLAIAVIAAFKVFGGKIAALFRKASTKLQEAGEVEY